MTEAEEIRIAERTAALLRRNGHSWQPVVTQVLIALAPTLAAAIVWFKANSTHELVNSRMTELLEITKRKGEQDGRNQERRSVGTAVIEPSDKPFVEALKQLIETYEKK